MNSNQQGGPSAPFIPGDKTLRRLVDQVVTDSKHADIRSVAETVVKGVPENVARELAVHTLAFYARQTWRAQTAAEERASQNAGRSPEEQAQLDQIREAHLRDLIVDLTKTVDRFADHVRVEWTEELRRASFRLSDGTRTTWGEATVEQHEERVQEFARRSALNIEGAARHEAAARALREAGAECLDQMIENVPA